MDDKTVSVPYFVAEGMVDRVSRTNKRLWIMCILLIILLVGTNAMWIWYESQWTYEEIQEVTQRADEGYNYYIGGNLNGDANNKDYKAED